MNRLQLQPQCGEPRIDPERLWDSLEEMSAIGATDSGGVRRLALTNEDKRGRDLFVDWCQAAGCTVTIDQMGNIFARREGADPNAPVVMAGSHLDSQPTGGRFDGTYGVLAGLEVIRTLNDYRYITRAPIEIAVWTNEEGTRFAPAMISSGVFAGVFDIAYGLSRTDREGRTLGQELRRIGYAGPLAVGGRRARAYIEAHIEQGPILEAEGKTIGVVSGAQGQRWYEISLTGQEAHAGPTPMHYRRDALVGAARIVQQVNRIGQSYLPGACATVGVLDVYPNSRNTIPGRVFMTVDLRHPEENELSKMDAELRRCVDDIASTNGLTISLEQIWHSPAIRFDPTCIRVISNAAARLGLSSMSIISGAGHDACYLSRVAPTGMIFIPCEGGISHNEAESATPEDAEAGAQVLLLSLLELAERG